MVDPYTIGLPYVIGVNEDGSKIITIDITIRDGNYIDQNTDHRKEIAEALEAAWLFAQQLEVDE